MNPLKSLCRLLATFARPFWGWAPEDAQDASTPQSGPLTQSEPSGSATGRESAKLTPLKVYDGNTECPACGAGENRHWDIRHSTRYESEHWMVYGEGLKIREWFNRTCRRCGYVWIETPLNAARRDVAQNRMERR